MSVNVKSADDPLGLGATQNSTTPPPPAAPDSIIAKLREKRAKQAKIKTEAFEVGGEFGEMLQIRYKPLEPDHLDDFLAKIDEVNMQRAIQMNMDMMSKACVGVEGYDPETKERTPLLDDAGQPILLDNRLAVLLDMPIPGGFPLTAREVITLLFGNNGLAIGAHGDKVTDWMRDPKPTASDART